MKNLILKLNDEYIKKGDVNTDINIYDYED